MSQQRVEREEARRLEDNQQEDISQREATVGEKTKN